VGTQDPAASITSPAGAALRRPSLADVASLAGVSRQTVSRVVNGSAAVRPETRARVATVIQELGYRPDPAARALATGGRESVGIVTLGRPAAENAAIRNALRSAASAAGVRTVVAGSEGERRADVERAFADLAVERPGVIVVIGSSPWSRAAAELVAPGTPLVHADDAPADPAADPQRTAARIATEHLLAAGHSRVGHVAGPACSGTARRRAAGWRDAMRAAGLPVFAIAEGSWSERTGYEATRRLLSRCAVTAVLAASDATAVGALHAVRDAGEAAPDGISVVGMGDSGMSAHCAPPLTTVRLDLAALGRSLFDRARDGTSATHVACALVVRDSVRHHPSTRTAP
jgi:DNA-binding LacI/PurR family transcriptional regulator